MNVWSGLGSVYDVRFGSECDLIASSGDDASSSSKKFPVPRKSSLIRVLEFPVPLVCTYAPAPGLASSTRRRTCRREAERDEQSSTKGGTAVRPAPAEARGQVI